VLSEGTLGLGESYMDGWFECDALDQFIFRLLRSDLHKHAKFSWSALAAFLQMKISSTLFVRARAFLVAEKHYDLSNELFRIMLDQRMIYSCGYWKNAKTLDDAQRDKLELICKKLQLRSGQRVLDIGCGWGGFARYAAENYGVSVVGITVSKEQVALATQHCSGLPVEIRLQDYRELDPRTERFDRICSVGMFEHVCAENYRNYLQIVHQMLADDNGLFLLHTIGDNVTSIISDPWLNKYIFPNSMLPSIKQIGAAAEALFVIEDWHNFGADYDRTLMAWFQNFEKNWPTIHHLFAGEDGGQRFYRMWKYYLLSCAGLFRARGVQLWQIVLSKSGVDGGYVSLR